jgi:hypothetical protein
MSLPGFTAEASLHEQGGRHAMSAGRGAGLGRRVSPQILPGGKSMKCSDLAKLAQAAENAYDGCRTATCRTAYLDYWAEALATYDANGC